MKLKNKTYSKFLESFSKKENCGNTLTKLFKNSEEIVTKINFFEPSGLDKENPYNLRKNLIDENRKDKNEIQLSRLIDYIEFLPNINDRIVDKNKSLERLENLNNEIKLEKERKRLIVKNKELKYEKTNLLRALNSLYKEIRSLHVDAEFLQNFDKLMDTDEKLKRILNEDQSIKGTKKKNIKIRSFFENEKIIQEFRNASWKREQELKEKNDLIISKEKSYKILKDKIIEFDKQCEKNIMIIDQITNKLIYHYHTLLSEGKDTRKEGLVWIIKAIWNLGANVIISFLPNFLDEKCIKFIFKYANKDIELEKFHEEIKHIKNNVNEYYKEHKSDLNRYMFKTEEERSRNPNTNRKSKVFLSIEQFNSNHMHNYDDLNFRKIKGIVEKTDVDPKTKHFIDNLKSLEDKLEVKKKELKALQQIELDRLNKEFLVNDYARRFKIDQETLIATIIGKHSASNEYSKKLREQKVSLLYKVGILPKVKFVPSQAKDSLLTRSSLDTKEMTIELNAETEP